MAQLKHLGPNRRRTTLLALLVTAASFAAVPAAEAGGCTDEGGSELAKCTYQCRSREYLSVDVVTHDDVKPYADASGETECGGAAASCGVKEKECGGVSKTRTTSPGEGTCTGRSHEFWGSGVTVTCESWNPDDEDPPKPPKEDNLICIYLDRYITLKADIDDICVRDPVGVDVETDHFTRATLPVRLSPDANVPAEVLDTLADVTPRDGATGTTVLHVLPGGAYAFHFQDGAWVPAPVACAAGASGAVECAAPLAPRVAA